MKAADVIFKFVANTKDLISKTENLRKDLSQAAKIAGKAFMGMATVAKTALISITTKAVQMRGEVEQQIGGTKAVFKEFAKTVQSDASAAFDKMGVSANKYMAYINKMGSLMQGTGISTKRSMELSSQAMQRAADVASIMGISVDDAMTAISGAAKGNFTMMDNLGVAMNATSLSAYALEKGLKKTYATMSQGERVELAMQMFLEKSAYAAGNYAKENETFAGSLNTLRAAAQNLLAGTGTIEQVMTSIKQFATILVQKIQEILPNIVDGIVNLINGLLPMIPDLVQALLPGLIKGITDLTLKLIETLPQIVMLISDMLPDLIPQLVDAIMLIIPELIKNYPLFVKAGLKLFIGLAKGIAIGAGKLVLDLIDIGTDLLKGLWNGIKNAKDWLWNKIKELGSTIMEWVKGIFGISSPSKEFAIIGKYNILGLEEGMEKESLKLQDGFNEMFSMNPNLYGTAQTNLSPNINVINNINMKQNSLGQMVNDIKTFSGGAKNDYSYGMGA